MAIDAELVTRKLVRIAKDLDILRTVFDKGPESYLTTKRWANVISNVRSGG